MKNNILPAIIIAAALLACGFLVRQTFIASAESQMDAMLTKLEEASRKKADGSDARITTVIKSFSSAVSAGFKAGISDTTDQQNRIQGELKVRDALVFREVKIVPSQQKNQERVIGLVKNGSDSALNNVQLSILYKDKAGSLLEVGSGHVRGILRPGEEAGFEGNRSLGDFKEKEEVLAQRKADSVVVTVTGFTKG